MGLRLAKLLFMALLALEAAAVTIKVRVTDNFTQLPVAGAEVSLERISGKAPALVEKYFVPASGALQFDLPDKASMFQFQIQAADYGAFQSPRFAAADADPFYDVQLARQKDFEGVLIAPTGQLAAKAQYFICTDLTEVTFPKEPERTFFTRSKPPEFSAPDGRFRLSPEPTGHSIIVAHELGFAVRPLFGWTNGSTIKLRPWARVAGTFRINGQAAAGQRLTLEATENALGGTKMTFLNFESITDKEGRFAFENVPPGPIYALWKIPVKEGGFAPSHRTLIEADPFRPDDIELNLKGRNLSGSLKLDVAADWRQYRLIAYLMTKPAEIPLELWRPNAGLTPSLTRHYAIMVNSQLAISGAAIPPGDYSIRLYANPLPDANANARLSHYSFQGRVAVPDGAGALDLAQIVVTNTAPARN